MSASVSQLKGHARGHIGSLIERMDRAIKNLSQLEHATGIQDEYGKSENLRLQAKRHGVMLARSYAQEAFDELTEGMS